MKISLHIREALRYFTLYVQSLHFTHIWFDLAHTTCHIIIMIFHFIKGALRHFTLDVRLHLHWKNEWFNLAQTTCVIIVHHFFIYLFIYLFILVGFFCNKMLLKMFLLHVFCGPHLAFKSFCVVINSFLYYNSQSYLLFIYLLIYLFIFLFICLLILFIYLF